MKITYDPTVDALYIRFQETTVTTISATNPVILTRIATRPLGGDREYQERMDGVGGYGTDLTALP